jgi:hypothetical protein
MMRPCLGVAGQRCAAVIPLSQRRCADCARRWGQQRWQRRAPTQRQRYYPGYRRDRQALVAAEPWCHTQPRCPYPDAGTPANRLTEDHVIAFSRGGADGPRTVLCLRCNSAKRDRPDTRAGGAGRGADGGGGIGHQPRSRLSPPRARAGTPFNERPQETAGGTVGLPGATASSPPRLPHGEENQSSSPGKEPK